MGQAEARNHKLYLGVPYEWQEPNYFCQHVLRSRMCLSRKLESGVEPGLEPRHSSMGYGHPKQWLNCCATMSTPKILIYLKDRVRARAREREKERGILHLVVHSPKACNSQGWAKSKPGLKLNPSFQHGWQRPKYLSHHLLPPRICISRKLELEVELGLEPWHSDMQVSQAVFQLLFQIPSLEYSLDIS